MSRVKYVRAAPLLKMKHPTNMAVLGPTNLLMKPDRGMNTPWVIPHTLCTMMKSA